MGRSGFEPLKAYASGFTVRPDLHSNNLFVAIIDAQGRRIKDGRLFCELHEIEKFLRPYRSRIVSIAVESTFNWYWLVDGLQDLGYQVLLAKPAELTQYDGLKHADDQSDAFFLAELLRLGTCPPVMCASESCAPSAICCAGALHWLPSERP
jgi:transposase